MMMQLCNQINWYGDKIFFVHHNNVICIFFPDQTNQTMITSSLISNKRIKEIEFISKNTNKM